MFTIHGMIILTRIEYPNLGHVESHELLFINQSWLSLTNNTSLVVSLICRYVKFGRKVLFPASLKAEPLLPQVLVAEAAKKKKKQQATAANCCGAEGSPRTAAGAGAGAADSCRRDRSWLTSRGSSSSQRLVSDPSDLRDALDGLVRLRVEDDPPPAAPAPAPADAAGQRRGGGHQERDQEDREEAEDATGGADAEDWMTSSFDEDWFLSTEREQEEERRREEEERARREQERARREAEGECVDRNSRQDKQKEETTGRGSENEEHIF